MSLSEGNSGTTPFTFTATLSRPLSQPIVVCATTLGLTASDPSDYTALGECRTLAAGTTSTTFTVSVKGDKKKETDEQFALLVVAAPFVKLADPARSARPARSAQLPRCCGVGSAPTPQLRGSCVDLLGEHHPKIGVSATEVLAF